MLTCLWIKFMRRCCYVSKLRSMWCSRVGRAIQKVGIKENRTFSQCNTGAWVRDLASKCNKTDQCGICVEKLKLTLTTNVNKRFTRHYVVSSKFLAKNSSAVEEKVIAKDDKTHILEKIKADIFKDDPELKRTIVEMYEDFDDRSSSPMKDENKDKKTEYEAKAVQVSDAIPYSLQDKFQVYRDSDAETILDEVDQFQMQQGDIAEEEVTFSIYRQKKDELAGLTFTRGEEGVFDIGELVDILKKENAQDICVMTVPPELHYTDYMVVVSAISQRHVRAIGEFLQKLYKRKKAAEDKFVVLEGTSCSDWQVLDMGNIVLHIFMPETRMRYDLETLWTVGHQFDDLTQRPPVDSVFEALQSHLQFLEDMKPASPNSAESPRAS